MLVLKLLQLLQLFLFTPSSLGVVFVAPLLFFLQLRLQCMLQLATALDGG